MNKRGYEYLLRIADGELSSKISATDSVRRSDVVGLALAAAADLLTKSIALRAVGASASLTSITDYHSETWAEEAKRIAAANGINLGSK